MSLLALAAAAALTLVDPTGDAAGDGTLEPPTSPVYANAALFDLQELTIETASDPAAQGVLRLKVGAVDLDTTQPAGYNRAVFDVYLDYEEGGAEATLRGPGMLMPTGRAWDYAVRVSPRGAFGASAPLGPEAPAAWTPLDLVLEGDVFVVDLPAEVTGNVEAYAVSGVYDAFSPDSWRPLSRSPSPWSYSGAEQVVPVIDVLAPSFESQVRAVRDGVLPAASRRAAGGLMWLLLSMTGVLIAATGLWLRRLVRPPTPEDAAEGPLDAEVGAEDDVTEGATSGFGSFGLESEEAEDEVEDDMLGFVDRRPRPLEVETTEDDLDPGSANDMAEGREEDLPERRQDDLAEGRGDDLAEDPEDYLAVDKDISEGSDDDRSPGGA